ncbi:DUF5655 domain-containing protein [Gimesia chilikensis]|uniref:DUF5655 domain-containing protein n=1 Tax=Gimesia chilikensis TaxID=2605989 RepID=A0A517PL43_9PLAN|nr:DUF5655 domain-containing protein [Gimesia chilikensis]QDT20099.1 hypothetical protein HG66A1_18840 [Gimesia chilikensis]
MSDIKLFRTQGDAVTELEGKTVALEKSLQILIENHLETLLGIKFLASEYSTGKTHAGRIDTLGIDENGCPCIIEYKRTSNENVINQGLFYLDWLMDHRAEFELMVIKQFGQEMAENIEWSNPRLLCIAGDFNKYDSHAVQQMNRNIELLRYIRFDEELLLLELLNAVQASSASENTSAVDNEKSKSKSKDRTVVEQLEQASPQLRDVFETLKETCLGFGDDVQIKTPKRYIAFKRLKNFVCVDVRATINTLLVFVKVNPDTVDLEEGFTRDVRDIAHFGTGNLEITLHSQEDLVRALPLIEESYQAS